MKIGYDSLMTEESRQAPSGLYTKPTYLNQERWASYWHQIDMIRAFNPKTVLEIGVGNGLVKNALAALGYDVQTVDIDPSLKPTHVASVTALPFPDQAFDVVLCAEVLEHLPFEESLVAMKEIRRVTRLAAVITLPHAGYVFSLLMKLPLLPWIAVGCKLPHFWKTHRFKGEHYWETGKRGWPRRKIRRALEQSGWRVTFERIFPDNPAHVAFICLPTNTEGHQPV